MANTSPALLYPHAEGDDDDDDEEEEAEDEYPTEELSEPSSLLGGPVARLPSPRARPMQRGVELLPPVQPPAPQTMIPSSPQTTMPSGPQTTMPSTPQTSMLSNNSSCQYPSSIPPAGYGGHSPLPAYGGLISPPPPAYTTGFRSTTPNYQRSESHSSLWGQGKKAGSMGCCWGCLPDVFGVGALYQALQAAHEDLAARIGTKEDSDRQALDQLLQQRLRKLEYDIMQLGGLRQQGGGQEFPQKAYDALLRLMDQAETQAAQTEEAQSSLMNLQNSMDDIMQRQQDLEARLENMQTQLGPEELDDRLLPIRDSLETLEHAIEGSGPEYVGVQRAQIGDRVLQVDQAWDASMNRAKQACKEVEGVAKGLKREQEQLVRRLEDASQKQQHQVTAQQQLTQAQHTVLQKFAQVVTRIEPVATQLDALRAVAAAAQHPMDRESPKILPSRGVVGAGAGGENPMLQRIPPIGALQVAPLQAQPRDLAQEILKEIALLKAGVQQCLEAQRSTISVDSLQALLQEVMRKNSDGRAKGHRGARAPQHLSPGLQ